MLDDDAFSVIIENFLLYVSCVFFFCASIYFIIRKIAIAGILDPLHFYLTFTFGTAYGFVSVLYLKGYIENFYLGIILIYGIFFYISLCFFTTLLRPFSIQIFYHKSKRVRRYIYILSFTIYFSLLLVLLFSTGLGVLTDSNRFEQSRGYGHFVRMFNCIKPFVMSLIFIYIIEYCNKNKIDLQVFLFLLVFSLLLIINCMIDGSKFSMLGSFYVLIVAYSIRYRKPKLNLLYKSLLLIVSLCFALTVLRFNLVRNGLDLDNSETVYLTSGSVLHERFLFRIFANADKYFYGLPDGVVDKIEADNLFVRIMEPIFGITVMSKLMGYQTSEFNVGRQLTKYHHPDYDIAGGATSHFDLFSYKYFGYFFGIFNVGFIGLVLSIIINISKSSNRTISSCLSATLYNNSLAILLEPCIGFSYILDFLFLFSFIFIVSVIIAPRRSISQAVSSRSMDRS
jgi:hypothetical protein